MLRQKMCLINIPMGRPLQIVDSGKLVHIMAKSFPVFSARNGFSDF
jgi:hypothetical protein